MSRDRQDDRSDPRPNRFGGFKRRRRRLADSNSDFDAELRRWITRRPCESLPDDFGNPPPCFDDTYAQRWVLTRHVGGLNTLPDIFRPELLQGVVVVRLISPR